MDILRVGILAAAVLLTVRYKRAAKRKEAARRETRANTKISRYAPAWVTVYNKERDVVLSEPSLIALDKDFQTVRYVGREAGGGDLGQIAGEEMVAGSPFRNGAVAEFELAADLMKIFLRYARQTGLFARPRIAVCVQEEMTDVERTALSQCMRKAGGREVLVLEGSFASLAGEIPPKYSVVVELAPQG